MDELNAAMEVGTSVAVKIWINWMFLVFAGSLIFVWKHKNARAVLVVFILTLPIGFVIWRMSGNIDLLGITHLLLWIPLLVYLYLKDIKSPEFKAQSVYGIWVLLLSATIVVSLVFDVRDIFLVLTGVK